ncbi:MAG: hypothetical protein ACI9TH_000294 [Kiritimatiellia bacterium]|jgi:hypothetical protein
MVRTWKNAWVMGLPRMVLRIVAVLLFAGITSAQNDPAVTDPEITREVEAMGKKIARKKALYFEGNVTITRFKPEQSTQKHAFITWFFKDGKRYKTYYEEPVGRLNAVWDGEHCYTWTEAPGEEPIGMSTEAPNWQIDADHLLSPSDYIIDGLYGYEGLLKHFVFSDRIERDTLRIYNLTPSDSNPLRARMPDNAIIRLIFDSETGLIEAVYNELPGKMRASFKVNEHRYEGSPAIILRKPGKIAFNQ